MIQLLETPKTYVSRTKSTAAPACTDQQFSRMEESGRIIRSYSGFLPSTRQTARHILRCEHLKDVPGERLPYRAEPSFTHQIWLWYRLNRYPDKLYLLFRGQFDFTIQGLDPDVVASRISDSLADLLLDCNRSKREAFRHQDSTTFWALAVERKFKSLSIGY